MSVLSPNHHSRHLQTDEERAAFNRTAPIETRNYWDLADEMNRPSPNVEAIQEEADKVIAELRDRHAAGEERLVQRVASHIGHTLRTIREESTN